MLHKAVCVRGPIWEFDPFGEFGHFGNLTTVANFSEASVDSFSPADQR